MVSLGRHIQWWIEMAYLIYDLWFTFKKQLELWLPFVKNISNHDVLVEKHQSQIKKDVQILQPFVVKRWEWFDCQKYVLNRRRLCQQEIVQCSHVYLSTHLVITSVGWL